MAETVSGKSVSTPIEKELIAHRGGGEDACAFVRVPLGSFGGVRRSVYWDGDGADRL